MPRLYLKNVSHKSSCPYTTSKQNTNKSIQHDGANPIISDNDMSSCMQLNAIQASPILRQWHESIELVLKAGGALIILE
jgi:hypothetical protein